MPLESRYETRCRGSETGQEEWKERGRGREKLNTAGEDVLAGMIGSNVLIKIAALLGSVSAIGTLELRLLAALVSGVPDQGGAMLVSFAARLAPIRKLDPLRHPEGRQVLHQRQHRVVAIPLIVLRHSDAGDR